MNFFAAFDAWLRVQLATFVADRTALLAGLIEPFLVVCGVVYVMVWGWLQITGRIDQPVLEGTRRILVLAVIFGFAVRLWSFNAFFVDTFMTSPQLIATAFAAGGATSTVTVADTVLADGATVAENLFKQAGVFSGNWGFYLAGGAVYLAVLLVATYAAFLDALARIALSVILALGPLFLVGLLFDSTRRFFEAWVAQLSNYALVTILTGAVTGLLMQVVRTEAATMAAVGTAIQIAEVIALIAACVLILLVMRQIMPIASGLSSGVALASMHAVSTSLAWSLGKTAQFARGTTDRDTSRWDPVARRLGFRARRGTQWLMGTNTAPAASVSSRRAIERAAAPIAARRLDN